MNISCDIRVRNLNDRKLLVDERNLNILNPSSNYFSVIPMYFVILFLSVLKQEIHKTNAWPFGFVSILVKLTLLYFVGGQAFKFIKFILSFNGAYFNFSYWPEKNIFLYYYSFRKQKNSVRKRIKCLTEAGI